MGLDRVLKKANAKDGIVKIKNATAIESDPACISVNDSYVAIGTDNGGVYVFEQSDLTLVKFFPEVHQDNVAGIFPLPEKNKHHFVTCGSSTVVHLDTRKPKPVSESEDQEDDILCGCLSNEKAAVFGMSTGVLTVWNEAFEDQQHRVRLSQESVDCVIPGDLDDIVIAGCGDGIAYKVNSRSSKVLKKYKHGSDGLSSLEMDYQYHLVTADMESIIVWMTDDEEKKAEKKEPTKDNSTKRALDADNDGDNSDWENVSDDSDDSDHKKKEDNLPAKKKRKRGKKSAKDKVYKGTSHIASFEGL